MRYEPDHRDRCHGKQNDARDSDEDVSASEVLGAVETLRHTPMLPLLRALRHGSVEQLRDLGRLVRVTSKTYEPMDRNAARRDPAVLSEATRRVIAFFNTQELYPAFEPQDQPASGALKHIDDVTAAVRAAFHDRDWIEGYQRGRADAERALAGVELEGPGITENPREGGFSPSGNRRIAYEQGRQDGELA